MIVAHELLTAKQPHKVGGRTGDEVLRARLAALEAKR